MRTLKKPEHMASPPNTNEDALQLIAKNLDKAASQQPRRGSVTGRGGLASGRSSGSVPSSPAVGAATPVRHDAELESFR
jgi:hypothetical protein